MVELLQRWTLVLAVFDRDLAGVMGCKPDRHTGVSRRMKLRRLGSAGAFVSYRRLYIEHLVLTPTQW